MQIRLFCATRCDDPAVLEERIVGWLDGHPIAMSLAVIGLDLSEAGACGEAGQPGSLRHDGGCG
jgi:hypothetical protein